MRRAPSAFAPDVHHVLLVLVAAPFLIAGCAGITDKGRDALRAGQWETAAGYFREAVARDPESVDALVGLGVSRYRLGDHGEAADALGRALALQPNRADARLYLGLSSLMSGDDGRAEEHLTAFGKLAGYPALTGRIEQALRLLRAELLTDEIRQFIASSLDNEAILSRQLQDAQAAASRGPLVPSRGFMSCVPTRHGRLICY